MFIPLTPDVTSGLNPEGPGTMNPVLDLSVGSDRQTSWGQ